jgi:hypothetical protein
MDAALLVSAAIAAIAILVALIFMPGRKAVVSTESAAVERVAWLSIGLRERKDWPPPG